ncbi:MAG: hypothetical protein QM723_02335 [Myxococcaceae bacterium]
MSLFALTASIVVAAAPDAEVQRLFHDGDVAAARVRAKGCAPVNASCRYLYRRIQEFNERRMFLHELSADELFKLLRLDRELAGGQQSEGSREIAAIAVSAACDEAIRCNRYRDWAGALHHAGQIMRLDSKNECANSVIRAVRNAQSDDEELARTIGNGEHGRIILVEDPPTPLGGSRR